jgi:hypothetical protein
MEYLQQLKQEWAASKRLQHVEAAACKEPIESLRACYKECVPDVMAWLAWLLGAAPPTQPLARPPHPTLRFS